MAFVSRFCRISALNKFKNKFNYQNRTLKTISINDITETIIERTDYPKYKCREIIGEKNIGIIGYGPQGRGQSLNLKDNGFKVNIGVRKGDSYDTAVKDGWIPNKNLFSIEETCDKSDIIHFETKNYKCYLSRRCHDSNRNNIRKIDYTCHEKSNYKKQSINTGQNQKCDGQIIDNNTFGLDLKIS